MPRLSYVNVHKGCLLSETNTGRGNFCASCNDGYWRNETGQCNAHTVCSSQQYVSTLATNISDRVCTNLTTCSSQQYMSCLTNISDRVCKDLCMLPQQYIFEIATSTSDRVCTNLTVFTKTLRVDARDEHERPRLHQFDRMHRRNLWHKTGYWRYHRVSSMERPVQCQPI